MMKKTDLEIVRNSAYFKADWYKKTYLLNDDIDAAEHYLLVGWNNGFNPSKYFSTYQYLCDNPDVRNAGMNPLVHYEKSGKFENRKITSVKYEHLPVCLKSQKTRVIEMPESAVNERTNIDEIVDKLSSYDLVSFDVFDTLIVRGVSSPTDIFRIVGIEKGISKFAEFRELAEKEAYSTLNAEKVNLHDIYNILSRYMDIGCLDDAVAYEEDVEKRFCYVNSYMKEVTNRLHDKNVRMIVTSDMYLSKQCISDILKSAGYNCFENIFISNEIGYTKGNGSLQKYVQDKIGSNIKIVHVGDNYSSDFKASKEAGWSSIYYESCHQRGLKHRSTLQGSIGLSIYSALCDNHLLNGIHQYTKEYEHGYLFGGLIVYGYCTWLNELTKQKKAEKIWFFGRDMDAVYKAYKKYFNQYPCEYVETSRASAMELTVQNNLEEFIQYSFMSRSSASAKQTIEECLFETGLSSLLKYLPEYSLQKEDLFSAEQYKKVRELIYDHKNEVVEIFEPSVHAAEKYFAEKLGNSTSILMVDAGWSGTIFNQLRLFFSQRNKRITLHAALLGGYPGKSVIDNELSGFLSTYLFSGTHSFEGSIDPSFSDGWVKANLFEAMFTSAQNTLLKYQLNNQGEYAFVYSKDSNNNADIIMEMQEGILDFCGEYIEIIKKIKHDIRLTSEEVFRPYRTISDDYDYFNRLFSQVRDYKDRKNHIQSKKETDFTTVEEMLEEHGLI
jgi:FMN phosphatase YigB (HAD superfamily)